MSAAEPEEIRAEIERTRADLADTVDALSAKLDVKARASEKAQQAKQSGLSAVATAKAATPPPVQHALDRVTAALEPVAIRAKPYRGRIAAAGGALLAVVLVARQRSR